MLKAVIFDFDGVIHDTFEITYRIVKSIYTDIDEEEYKGYFDSNVQQNKKATKDFLKEYFKQQKKEYSKLIIDSEVKSLLIELSKNYKLFIDIRLKSSIPFLILTFFHKN